MATKKRTNRYLLGLTDNEIEILKTRASKLGLSVSNYIRYKTIYEGEG